LRANACYHVINLEAVFADDEDRLCFLRQQG
jgi:hypothetical protein